MRSRARRQLSLAPLALLAVSLPALGALGCSAGGGTPASTGTLVAATVTRDLAPSVPPANEAALVTGNTQFAFAMYHGISSASGASSGTIGNFFYSPYSVSLALAMAYAGAHGDTASQIATALNFTLPEGSLNPAFDKLDLAIEKTPANATGQDGQPFAVKVADSLWGEQTVDFDPTFVNALAQSYGAGLRTVDFASNPNAAEQAINTWVANETNDLINPLLAPNQVPSTTEFVIVNAVYFNAGWQTPFEAVATQPGTFTRADGSAVQASMMLSDEAVTTYAKGSNWQAVELPYSGGTTSMVVVLPDAGAYSAVEQGLSGAFYASVTAALARTGIVELTMPKFTIHGSTISLVPALTALGMTDAFSPSVADFTAMIPAGGTYISDVLHQAFVDVDETGTEAAAATGVIGVGSAAPVPTVTVKADHPFFFFIRDIASNTVLFVGREGDPTAQ